MKRRIIWNYAYKHYLMIANRWTLESVDCLLYFSLHHLIFRQLIFRRGYACITICAWKFHYCVGNFEIIHRVQLLQDALGKAIIISKEATHRIEELQVQLSIVQRQCTTRDRPLCDTLRLRSFDDNGILNTLTKVKPSICLIQFTFPILANGSGYLFSARCCFFPPYYTIYDSGSIPIAIERTNNDNTHCKRSRHEFTRPIGFDDYPARAMPYSTCSSFITFFSLFSLCFCLYGAWTAWRTSI